MSSVAQGPANAEEHPLASRSEAREEVVTKVEREPGGEKGPYARRRPKAGREAVVSLR